MRKWLLFVASGAFAITACVGDAPAAPTTVAQGDLGGACFSNGTCNATLSCGVVEGSAQCIATSGMPTGDASPPGDSSVDDETGSSDAGPAPCKFQTTTFPCGGENPPSACYGAAQSCTLTGCNPGDILWACNSARQCDSVCCVPAAVATVTIGADCAEGKLLIKTDATTGAVCSTQPACAAGDTQLCQANSDCPAGQHCAPVRIGGGGAASLSGTIVAACAP